MNNFVALTFILANLFVGISQNNENKKVMIDFNKKFNESCDSAFSISDDFGYKSSLKEEVNAYLYRCLIDNEKCKLDYKDIFKYDTSFVKLVLYIYQSESFLKYNIYEYPSEWIEKYSNLLYYCTNDDLVCRISDLLLEKDIDDGLVVMWKEDITVLNNLKDFIKKNSQDIYRLSLIATCYHNNNYYKERDQLLKKIIDLDENKGRELEKTYKEESKISYFNYIEIINGGI